MELVATGIPGPEAAQALAQASTTENTEPITAQPAPAAATVIPEAQIGWWQTIKNLVSKPSGT